MSTNCLLLAVESLAEFLWQIEGNRFLDRRISQKKLFGFRIWRIFCTDLRILLIQQIADLSNILARIVNLACNLVWILDCDFIVELLADSNLDKTIVGSRILRQIWADRRICIPLFTPPPQIVMKFNTFPDKSAQIFLIFHSSCPNFHGFSKCWGRGSCPLSLCTICLYVRLFGSIGCGLTY